MKKNIILFIISFAMFMEAVDTTIINTAIPVMAQSLNVNPIDLKLALISYLLSLAIFIPISGWIADKFGMKTVFIVAISVFTLSSIWCGFTNNLGQLICARIIQGLGGALTIPIGRLIILRTCERHELITKMSIVVMVASLGMMLGPLLGGIITYRFSWRWIFWVNIPFGVLAVILSSKLLPSMPPRPVPPLDKLGFIFFGSGLATLTFGLSMVSESTASTIEILSTFMVALLLLGGYTKHSHKRKHPIVKVELLRTRTFCISVVGNILARLGFGGVPFLLPLLLQIGLGYSPRLSGLLLAPIALGVFLVKPLSFSILRWFGYKNLLIINTILVSISLWSFFSINQHSSVYSIAFLTFMYGFLIALQYTGMNSLAYANITENNMSAATSIMSTIQQLAQSFGVAVSAILLSIFTTMYSGGHALSVQIFHDTFLMLGILTFFSGIIFTFLKKEDGLELIQLPEH
ncbi:MFS transporter [Legionella qingyii]|uniref:MFS transporter n=1 Tax=Legionella qingyii TaxID=2184757 RepID=A0A317U3Z5_9GAMM|nr:DHA2 family efflux MFS transporter permease subunit [Legionella qingyii]PWY56683.1 MFS transporter [Legionella qingyii]RUR23430.1 DHA2 family efflux MFS transporter permease subunit [Legionella qingyii]RUR26123.1 DHA2 family efflux MFS transporter permease subunit [Legionella qingyii]